MGLLPEWTVLSIDVADAGLKQAERPCGHGNLWYLRLKVGNGCPGDDGSHPFQGGVSMGRTAAVPG